jgi:hypothetical protein
MSICTCAKRDLMTTRKTYKIVFFSRQGVSFTQETFRLKFEDFKEIMMRKDETDRHGVQMASKICFPLFFNDYF